MKSVIDLFLEEDLAGNSDIKENPARFISIIEAELSKKLEDCRGNKLCEQSAIKKAVTDLSYRKRECDKILTNKDPRKPDFCNKRYQSRIDKYNKKYINLIKKNSRGK